MDTNSGVLARKLDIDKSKGITYYVDDEKYRNSEDYEFKKLVDEIGVEGVIVMARKLDTNWVNSDKPPLEHAKEVITNSMANGGGNQYLLSPSSAPVMRTNCNSISPSGSLIMDC